MNNHISAFNQLEAYISNAKDGDIFYYGLTKYEIIGINKWEQLNSLPMNKHTCLNSIEQLVYDGIVIQHAIGLSVCGILQIGNRFISVKRKDSEEYGLIGGKVDEGEDIYSAIKREAFEETGFKVSIDFTKGMFLQEDPSGYLVLCFILTLDLNGHGEIGSNEVPTLSLLSKEQLITMSPFGEYNRLAFKFFNI